MTNGGPSAARPLRRPKRAHPAHPTPLQRVNQSTIIFLTLCVRDRRPLLTQPGVHDLLKSWWRRADRWRVGRYVVMPDHIHMFCSPTSLDVSFKQWLNYWRNGVTREWPGPSADKPIWQKDYWDTQLRIGDSYAVKWDYVRQNPVRAGLSGNAEAWPLQGECEVLFWHETT